MSRESIRQSLIDTANPETWEAAITSAQHHVREVAGGLICIAEDETRSNEDRRKAIFLLGKIDKEKSLDFLIENVTLYLEMRKIKGDEDALKERPCSYALRSTGNWKVAQAVFGSLNVPKSKLERIHLAGVLGSTLGKNLALAAIEEQLQRTPRPVTVERRENLEAIKVNLLD